MAVTNAKPERQRNKLFLVLLLFIIMKMKGVYEEQTSE
jgi:hypothetical protein